jgi:glutathione synthase/RimK-type ligase-like ATP-grasp enzyme
MGADVEEVQRTWLDAVAGTPAGMEIRMAALQELVFLADAAQSRIFHPAHGFDLAGFDLVVFKQWAEEPGRAIAAAAYARMHGIPYIDGAIPPVGTSKLDFAFTLAGHGLPVPPTLFGRPQDVLELLGGNSPPLRPPFVVKSVHGRKGRDNHLCPTVESVRTVFTQNRNLQFVVQPFIPNDGDWRVLVFGAQAKLALRRTAARGSHLNNTSAGGTAERVEVDSIPAAAVRDVIAAAAAVRLAVAGVDLITDRETGRHYVLEANSNPQLASGGFEDEKARFYREHLIDLLAGQVPNLKTASGS